MRRPRPWIAPLRNAALFALLLGAVAPGCGSASSDYCDVKCECENCSDKNYDECIVEADADRDVADVYGCTPEIDDLEDCAIRKYRCPNGHFEVPPADCGNQAKDLDDCIKAGSSIR